GTVAGLPIAFAAYFWGNRLLPLQIAERSSAEATGFGLRLVDALNIGTVAGLPIAFAAYFWGNRLLPLQIAERSSAEA
ncbi:hypothetical protein C7E12_22225, partial [Stenotrophomonas maltophilia]